MDGLNEIIASVARIELRMDSQDSKLSEIEKHVKETNGRVREVELFEAEYRGHMLGRQAAQAEEVQKEARRRQSPVTQILVGLVIGCGAATLAGLLTGVL